MSEVLLETAPSADESLAAAVRFAANCPGSVEEAVPYFSRFGELSSVDTTLSLSGVVVVAFFDVRCLRLLLLEYSDSAVPLKAPPGSFRAVFVPLEFSNLWMRSGFENFGAYGEVADCRIAESGVIVEYYDVRAVQRLKNALPCCQPRSLSSSSNLCAEEPAASEDDDEQQQLQQRESDQVAALLRSDPPSSDDTVENVPQKVRDIVTPPPSTHSRKAPLSDIKNSDVMKVPLPAPGKILPKVGAKDFSKFDVVPENIESGKDARTTVMIRQIPHTYTGKQFTESFLPKALRSEYTFFYMPFDKKNNRHTGCAFMNFRSPLDVLALHAHIRQHHSLNRKHRSCALSYAVLQGHGQLVQHFEQAAVMFDDDDEKRPFFCFGSKVGSLDPREVAAVRSRKSRGFD
eukprot:TRINITY_DN48641_c0_g1_i1.p1 TRINITY_DN48641_c0_g1~~TRINITY_DN48641_c0_g1_i1.p1  ORF type:complete len:419 (+),score=84.17 TRINITY_DN48641_c0_g1_i1:50-1258(+)